MTSNEAVGFWRESAENDLKVAEDNLGLGHYHWALFFFQLVLEKILKGLIVQKKKAGPIPTHDLVRLANEAEIKLTEDQKSDFKEITTFNIEARYDDIKLSFYKKATKNYAKKWAQKARGYYQWLKKL